MLRREQKIRNIILFTLFSLVFIGVGYAVISSNLTFNGSMRLNKITWDVHFENFEELYDNTVSATHTLTNNNTSLTYNVNLKKPGDIFEFTIDVVNNGNIDAMLSNIGKNGLTAAQQQVMDYNVTYLDGTTPAVKDSLKIGEVETFVISVKTKANITNAQLNATDTNLSLTFNPTYAQDDNTSTARPNSLYSTIVKDAVPDNIASTYVTSASGINFAESSSDENGKGIYLLKSTAVANEKIYYYRGSIDNNNVKFGGFCWKIVRTTEKGGIKLLYNGVPNGNDECLNKTGTDAGIGKYKYNNYNYSISFMGYMYGNTYTQKSFTNTSDYNYGKSITYQDGNYTLNNYTNELDNEHHYSCLSNSTQCEKVAFIYYLDNTTAYYIELENGDTYLSALNAMKQNVFDSNVKINIDNWFENNILNNIKYIQDTVYCNDRRQSTSGHGWNESGGLTGWMWFDVYRRIGTSIKTPSLSCETNDSFTVFEANGNGKLKYPVALITTDELMYSGIKYYDNSEILENYTNINDSWITMSPLYYKGNAAFHMYVHSNNKINSGTIGGYYITRPVLSLKHGIKISSGDGTQNNPYIIN